jgi:hypothetical protein
MERAKVHPPRPLHEKGFITCFDCRTNSCRFRKCTDHRSEVLKSGRRVDTDTGQGLVINCPGDFESIDTIIVLELT